jgi:hypothetical protein
LFKQGILVSYGQNPFMPYSTYKALPLEALYDLLESSVRDLLVAYETKADRMIAFNAMKKQVETLLDIITEKKKENLRKN